MNNVERLEVVRGPESTIYGTDAMTSVVQTVDDDRHARSSRCSNSAPMAAHFSTANG